MSREPLFESLRRCKVPEFQSFEDAWVGLEPTFSNRKAVEKWAKMSARPGGEDAYFEDGYMLGKLRRVGRAMEDRYNELRERRDPACLFGHVERKRDRDPWKVERVSLRFTAERGDEEAFEICFGIDPETFEFNIKPVPLTWLRDARFVRFLQLVVWDVPREHGLRPSIGHGGGQFSFSAKTWLQGSLLADDIATKLDHPELSTWICDYPNCDDRAFRATRARFEAFNRLLAAYWSGRFHPAARGAPTVENALLDHGFSPAENPPPDLVDPRHGPVGDARAVFQTNFAFGRATRWRGQNVHPGYWQSQHPDEEGYRPDQIMRYSEGNLNRLQIAGELHVKRGAVLDPESIPELDAPLEASMLYHDASWEQRAHMASTTAADFVSAILLDANHAAWLMANPRVTVRSSLAQDQLLCDAEAVLAQRAPRALSTLKKKARRANLEASRGRMKTDFVEPEALLWAAWKALGGGARAEIAREAILGFVERVESAASMDPRQKQGDPMEQHRHRVHPILWKALDGDAAARDKDATLRRESLAWHEHETRYRKRRPRWSPTDLKAPWK
ncbi:MAG: hypothetical protein ABJE95_15140 [Byssovorax sp.]